MKRFINLTNKPIAGSKTAPSESKPASFKPNNKVLAVKKSLAKAPLLPQREENFESTDRSLEIAELTKSRAFQAALSPGKSVVMYMFVFWMMGSNLNIFTIFFFFNAFMTPIKSILNLESTFKALENEYFSDFLFYKLIYIVINLGVLGFVLYKLYGIGLVPLNPSDYLDILPNQIQSTVISIGTN